MLVWLGLRRMHVKNSGGMTDSIAFVQATHRAQLHQCTAPAQYSTVSNVSTRSIMLCGTMQGYW